MRLRVYVTGRLCIEGGAAVIEDRHFPGQQGRLAFAYLLLSRQRVSREQLAAAIWPNQLPAEWESALSAIVTKLRTVLRRAGLIGAEALTSAAGLHELRLPANTWVDFEAAVNTLDEAEGALRAGDIGRAWSAATVVTAIARRPFLPGSEGAWVDRQRSELHGMLVRALDCLTEVWLARDDPVLAVRLAEELVGLEPFRDSGHRRLMTAYVRSGNRAEALRAYERCRQLLAKEFGVEPAAETTALRMALLADAPLPGASLASGTITLLFSDIEGSTAHTVRLGDERWAQLLQTHAAIVRSHIARHGGREIKTQGDGFMVAFTSARRAVRCGLDLQRAFADAAGKHTDAPLRVRIGIHTGEPVADGADFLGSSVNLAARIAGAAQGGQVLVSPLVRELTLTAGDIEFDKGHRVKLKGISEALRVYAARDRTP